MSEPTNISLSRRKFIVLAGGSVAGASALAACGDSSDAAGDGETDKFGDGDAGILNYLLTFDQLQAAFYSELGKSNLFTAEAREALGRFGEEEDEHIARLSEEVKKLGGKTKAPEKAEFSLQTETEALEQASTLENVGAAAYLGQLPYIESDELLKVVLEIHSVEGRHAAAINSLLKDPVTPDGAFAKPLTVKEALDALPPLRGEAEAPENKSV